MDKIVQEKYDKLILEIRKYRPKTSLKIIEDAFKFAYEAHKTQTRKTGEPYIIHPLCVAIILAEIHADLESMAAGLLHDVVEDTHHTSKDIVELFGEEIAHLVEGVTNIEKVAYVSRTDRQAENYRKMFFHTTQDLRVLLIKIADRLHNMRTLDGHNDEKKQEIAQETLDIYAPLAHRLGIATLRYELEDLGFKYTNRKKYDELAKKIEMKQSERQAFVEQIMREIRARLAKDRIVAHVEGRPKRFYSIHKKMVSKNKTLEELYDLYAVRVLVNEVRECYEVLGRLHEMFQPIPGRFKDYISLKKNNGYQSLHTGLMKPGGERFEVQIRTHEMHAVAQYGIAAHWRYKETGKAVKDKWLQEMMDWQRDMPEGEDFLHALKNDLNAYNEHIYCFTPMGELISLIGGACVIDFAYTIHSAVGNRMIGARVNGRNVPITHELHTGDQVEIVTSQNVKGPSKDWLKFAKSNTARTKINQWFNKENRDDNMQRGRELLEEAAKLESPDVPFSELIKGGRENAALERYSCKTIDQLFATVGSGGLKEKMVIHFLLREYEKTLAPPTDEELIKTLLEASTKLEKSKTGSGIIIRGVGDTHVRFARCCSPLPGDEILGYVTRGRGLSVHRSDCVNIVHMDEFERARLIETHWHPELKKENSYHSEMRINCDDRDGLIADIYKILSEEKIKVKTMNARTVQSEAIIDIGFEISDGERLDALTTKLRNIPGVCEIVRLSA